MSGGYAGRGAPSGTPAGCTFSGHLSAAFVSLRAGFRPWRGERACLAARAYVAAPVVVEVNPVFTNEGSRPYSVAVEAWHPGRLSAGRRHGAHLSADGAQPLAGKSVSLPAFRPRGAASVRITAKLRIMEKEENKYVAVAYELYTTDGERRRRAGRKGPGGTSVPVYHRHGLRPRRLRGAHRRARRGQRVRFRPARRPGLWRL